MQIFPHADKLKDLMVKKSLDALVNIDCDLASQVCQADDEIDAINHQMYDQVKGQINS